jgi:Flp pilus assembly CpaE family ATPase
VAVVSPDLKIRDAYGVALETHPRVHAVLTLPDYPVPAQLERLAESGLCVLFLDYGDGVRARAVAAEIDRAHPNIATIAVHPSRRTLDWLDLMKVGVREVVEETDPGVEVHDAFERAWRRLMSEAGGAEVGAPLFAFLPARPGSGATTVAIHAAAAAAQLGQQRTLLIDFDLRLGLTSFLLKLNGERSVLDALALSERLEDSLWEGLVNRRGMLDILGSAPVDFSQERRELQAAKLLRFVRQRYQAVCVDLPGELRDHEVETLQQAQEVFLVCTPELATLHLARRKVEALRSLEVLPRVSLLVNRVPKGRTQLSAAQIEELLDARVLLTLPAADGDVSQAAREASMVAPNTPFGRQIVKLGQRMMVGAPVAAKESRGRSFIDFFSVSPVREKALWR